MSRPHALITGGSSGIGLALARRLFADGMNLTLIARGGERLEAARTVLLGDCSDSSARVLSISADVSVRTEAEGAVAQAIAANGAPHLIVTSAGIARPGYFDEVPVEVFERTMAVNYLGTVYVAKAAVPAMKAAGGRIVMISSGAGLIGVFGYTPYSPTKFALRGFAEALQAELRHEGIAVSIAFPPDTDTPQLVEESRTKPDETCLMTARAGLWSAEAVADRILKGVARGAFAITPGFEITALYRLGSLISPLVQWGWARQVTRMRHRRELATSKE